MVGCNLSKQGEADTPQIIVPKEATLIPTITPIENILPKKQEEIIQSVQTTEERLVEKIKELPWATKANQIILVVGEEPTKARCMLLVREKDTLIVKYSTIGWIGKNGMGKTMEGDEKTPTGVYSLSHPFGRKEDPGCQIPYTVLDDSWYWVEDGNSQYYNQMVSTNMVAIDWTEAEQLNVYGGASYNYAIAIDYNLDRTPGIGSAIFIHCSHNSPTKGCIGIDEKRMVQTLQAIEEGAIIAIFENEDMIE